MALAEGGVAMEQQRLQPPSLFLMLAEARRALAELAALPDHAVVIEGACVEMMPEDVPGTDAAMAMASDAYPQAMQAAPGA